MESQVNIRRAVVLAPLIVVALAFTAAAPNRSATATMTATTNPWRPPPVRHVFVVNLENKSYNETFGAGSLAQYLNGTLLPKEQLLDNYYGVAPNTLPNY